MWLQEFYAYDSNFLITEVRKEVTGIYFYDMVTKQQNQLLAFLNVLLFFFIKGLCNHLSSQPMHVSQPTLRLRTQYPLPRLPPLPPLPHPPSRTIGESMKHSLLLTHVSMRPARPRRENAAHPRLILCDFTAGVSYINIVTNVLNVSSCQNLV